MKKLLAALAAACLVAAALLAIPAFGATRTVTIKDYAFGPKTLTVAKGTKVVWRWTGHAPHNVVSRGNFRSPLKTSGTWSRTFRRRATYRIICEIHPSMTMTLRVR